MKKLFTSALAVLCLLTIPQLVIAAAMPDNLSAEQTAAAVEIQSTVSSITSLIRLVGGTIGTLVITVGGVMFMTAGEKPEKKEQAKQILAMGVIGLVIILIAPAIVGFIIS